MDIINKYINAFTKQTYNKKDIIFFEGENCDRLGYVQNGLIKISTLTNNVKEEIINVVHKNEFFGENLLFSNYNTFMGTGEAITKTEVLWITKNKLLNLLKNEDFVEYYLSVLSNKEINLRFKNRLFSHQKISDRICFYLTVEYKKTKNLNVVLKSVTQLSNEINIPRPSVSRELTKLLNEGYIIKNKNIITLTNKFLKEYIN